MLCAVFLCTWSIFLSFCFLLKLDNLGEDFLEKLENNHVSCDLGLLTVKRTRKS